MHGNVVVALAVAILAGLVSFASPCVLPLVPGFLGYVTGLTGVPLAEQRRARVVLGAALFVLGFSVVFMLATVLASALGAALLEHQRVVSIVGGVLVILMALVFLGVGGSATVQPRWRPAAGLLGAPLLGVVFAIGWTPCMGPTLGVIITLATTLSGEGSRILRGAVLGLGYCIGLGVPFLLVAAGWARAMRAWRFLGRHHLALQRIGGAMLLIVGVLLVTGWWDGLMVQLQRQLIVGTELPL